MTSPDLRRVTRAADKAALALKARDDAIRAAVVNGATFEAAGRAAGLSKQRAYQICFPVSAANPSPREAS